MKTSETFKELPEALLKAQKAIDIVKFNKTAGGTKFSFQYADLEVVVKAVKGPLNDNDICFIQGTETVEDHHFVTTRLMHKSGEYIEFSTPILVAAKLDPQAFGSGVSYAKRYALMMVTGLVATGEDDGGDKAKKKSQAQEKAKNTLPKPNKAELEVIKKVYKALFDSAPEGLILNQDKIAIYIHGTKNGYISDLKKVGVIVTYMASSSQIMNSVCDKQARGAAKRNKTTSQKPKPEPKDMNPDNLRYNCFECMTSFDELGEQGVCPNCSSHKDIVDTDAPDTTDIPAPE